MVDPLMSEAINYSQRSGVQGHREGGGVFFLM